MAEYGPLTNKLRDDKEKLIKGLLHGRQRRDMRSSINKATAARERSREQGRLSAVIRSICGSHQEQYSLHQLILPDGTTTSNRITIHEAHTEHWESWLGGDGLPTFFDRHVIDWSDPQALKQDFMLFPSHLSIPTKTLETIREALTIPKYDDLVVKTKLAVATSRPVSIDDLKTAIARAPVASVPGPSGLSYAMMKTWSPTVLKEAFDDMTMIWETGQIPNWWKRKWLCPNGSLQFFPGRENFLTIHFHKSHLYELTL